MKNKIVIRMISLAIAISFILAGCSSTPDQVQDPLAGFDVNASIPFGTRAPVVSTATPSPAQPTFSPTPTQNPLAWQNVPGAGNAANTARPTPIPNPTPKPTPTPGPRDEVLSRGSQGNNVLLMQQRLIELEYLSGGADGKFGAKTESAVKLFQETMGLTVTGIADRLTLKYLYATDLKTYSQMVQSGQVTYAPTPVPSTQQGYSLLQKGSQGAEVTKLQNRLIQLGYMKDKADGNFGAVTELAVKLFQAALGWEKTGVATASLQSYLYSGSAPQYSGSTPAAPSTKAPTGSGSSYAQLAPGDMGDAVKNMQARLKELGYFDGEIAGNYLTKTTTAVKLFQAALGWEQTGIATAAMQEKLYSESAPKYTAPATPAPSQTTSAPSQPGVIMQYGDSGDRVRQLQQRLKELGYLDAEPTGNFLGQTEAAILLVQEQAGTKKTGAVTEQLYKYIFSDQIAPYEKVLGSDPDNEGQGDVSSSDLPDPNRVILKPNDTGSKVLKLQTALKELGYLDGEIGGNYYERTTTAVQLLQKMLGYEESGIATYALMERVLDASAPTYEQAMQYTHLYPGDTGDAVRNLQMRLVALGLFPDYDDSISGKFTLSTLTAVQLAQEQRGMLCIDEFASAEFQAYLFSDAAYYNSSAGTQE